MSVVLPVFNEEHEVTAIVSELCQAMDARGGPWEIVVVDNASHDDTVERLRPLLDDPRVRLLRNDQNHGKGYSVRRGMLAARGELRLMCDADCGPSLVSLPRMEALISEADVVAGARNARDSRVSRRQPLHRRVASLAFIYLCRRVMSEPLRDVFCGFKLFTAPAAVGVFSRARVDGWAFDVEALALARALGFRVRASGITWQNRPASRLSLLRVVLPALRELAAARAHVRAQSETARELHPAQAPSLDRPIGLGNAEEVLDGE